MKNPFSRRDVQVSLHFPFLDDPLTDTARGEQNATTDFIIPIRKEIERYAACRKGIRELTSRDLLCVNTVSPDRAPRSGNQKEALLALATTRDRNQYERLPSVSSLLAFLGSLSSRGTNFPHSFPSFHLPVEPLRRSYATRRAGERAYARAGTAVRYVPRCRIARLRVPLSNQLPFASLVVRRKRAASGEGVGEGRKTGRGVRELEMIRGPDSATV